MSVMWLVIQAITL